MGVEMTSDGEATYSQRIYADDIEAVPGLTSFGYSLAGGMDMDGNTYPDLAVGSYESDVVMYADSAPEGGTSAT